METFEVEGTTLVSWTVRVQAHNESESLEEAQRVVGWIDLSSTLATIRCAHHRIVRSRVTDSVAE
jgi:hypothetical protein